MDKDLKITPSQYSLLLVIFLLGYTSCQPIGSLLIRHLTPPILLGGSMIWWGLFTVL